MLTTQPHALKISFRYSICRTVLKLLATCDHNSKRVTSDAQHRNWDCELPRVLLSSEARLVIREGMFIATETVPLLHRTGPNTLGL